MSLLILPARQPGNRVAQQLDHYGGLTSMDFFASAPGIVVTRADCPVCVPSASDAGAGRPLGIGTHDHCGIGSDGD
jgi:hypothetical protein